MSAIERVLINRLIWTPSSVSDEQAVARNDEEGVGFWSCHGQPGMYENGVKHSDTPDLIRRQGVQGQVWPVTPQHGLLWGWGPDCNGSLAAFRV